MKSEARADGLTLAFDEAEVLEPCRLTWPRGRRWASIETTEVLPAYRRGVTTSKGPSPPRRQDLALRRADVPPSRPHRAHHC